MSRAVGWVAAARGAAAVRGFAGRGCQAYGVLGSGDEGRARGRNQLGASCFLRTGLHGTHAAGGVLVLLLTLLGSFRRNGLGPNAGDHVEIVGLYWHFVDIVWIVIFTLVYLIQP